MKKLKENKGITLIALIVTIIILLILAGVTIQLISGNEGILKQATNAVEVTQKGQYIEEISLEIYDEKTERLIEAKEEKYIESLQNRIKEKDWVKEVNICNERLEKAPEGNRLLIETKEGYELIINVDNETDSAKIEDYFEKRSDNYIITYDKNGGEGENIEFQEVRKNFSVILKENTFSKEGYKFVGWSEEKENTDKVYAENSEFLPQSSVTLYAIWEKKVVVTVNFNANGGTGTMESKQIVSNEETEVPKCTFTRPGYIFTGWNTNSYMSGNWFYEDSILKLTQNTTLYAQWIEEEYAYYIGTTSGSLVPRTSSDTLFLRKL